MPARVVLAMSGGVDSSVAAVLLKRQGYDVIGLFMRTGAHEGEPGTSAPGASHKKGCCSAQDAGDARRVADRLDIPFYALDFEADFNRIIDYFADEYLAGRTPNPCVVCNNWLKFGKLWSFGQQLDAEFIATGHYAQAIAPPGEFPQLHRAADPDKDQSYVLFGLQRSLLPRLLFPIGGYHKEEVRRIAREAGLATVAEKPDSVEICFVPDHDHAALVRRRRPGRATSGAVVDTAGTVLAEHAGVEQFTVGQRKGLNLGGGPKRYVLQIVAATNTVIVGDRAELLTDGLVASRINWLTDGPPTGPLTCSARIRYRHPGTPATVTATPAGGAEVRFAEPQPAVTPGQAVVFDDGPRILGGGWIERPLNPV